MSASWCPAVLESQLPEAEHTHLYEHVDPALVGNERHYLVSEMSGKALVLEKLAELRRKGVWQ